MNTFGRRGDSALNSPKIFISYRRNDSIAITGRIYDKLIHGFGSSNVFMDFDAIQPGVDFRDHLTESLKSCDALLVIIGPKWLVPLNSQGSNQTDYVRLEVSSALKRGIPVIPVLVGGAEMPSLDSLPDDLQPLVFRQAITVDQAQDFHVHVDRLVEVLRDIIPQEDSPDGFEEKTFVTRIFTAAKSLSRNIWRTRYRKGMAISVIALPVILIIVLSSWNTEKVLQKKLTEAKESLTVELDYLDAFIRFRELADKEYVPSYYFLGRLYHLGKGVKMDTAKAHEYYDLAIRDGDEKGSYGLGHLQFDYGKGENANEYFARSYDAIAKAAENGDSFWITRLAFLSLDTACCHGKHTNEDIIILLKEAIEQNNATAKYMLGRYYYDGRGVTQNYTKALKWCMDAADQGLADAQSFIGSIYDKGEGVTENDEEFLRWTQKAANNGNKYAQYNLANAFFDGNGIEKNHDQAFTWYLKSADQGYSYAQSQLGYMYDAGLSVIEDNSEAQKWYQRAADQNNMVAMYNIGSNYYNGDGVEKDLDKALEWYMRSAELGYSYAQSQLGYMYDAGSGVLEDNSEASKWYHKAAEQGSRVAMYNIGSNYYYGDGVEKDLDKALEWYMRSAELGYMDAQLKVGYMYDTGKSVKKDPEIANSWYLKAAEQDNSVAMYNLGINYNYGDGVEKDLEQAFAWYLKSAEKGYINAQKKVAGMYLNGDGVKKNTIEANKWYKEAAEEGDQESQYILASNYYRGIGTRPKKSLAIKWYKKAADQGHEKASEVLKNLCRKVKAKEIDDYVIRFTLGAYDACEE